MKNQSLLASSNRKRVSRRRKRLRSCRDEEQPPRNEFDVLVNRKRATTQSKTLIFPANINIILFLATTTLVAFLSSSANAFSTPRTLLLRRQSRGFTPPPSSITTLTRLQSQVRPPHQKPPKKTTRRVRKRIAKAVQIYTEYASRLWNETTPEVRQQIEREKASKSIQQVIRQIQHQEDHDTAAGSSSLSSSSSWHDAEDDEYDDDEEEEDAPLDPTLLRDLIEACNQAILKGEQQPHDATRINQKEDEHASILGDTLTHRHHDNGEESLPGRQEELLESTEEEEVKEDHLASAYDPIANERDQSATTPATATDAIAKATNLGLTTTRNSDVQPMDKEVELAQAAAAAAIAGESTAVVSSSPDNAKQPTAAAPKKKRRSIWFGAMMGAVVACWVFSGNYVFTGLFSLMTVLGQLEYYRMVINTGVYPARRISVVGACSMFWTALFCPQHHQIVLPLFGLWAMIWFLTMKRTATTIPEIATTFTGMFYLGYVPSFWVRIRLLGAGREPTRLAPLLGPILNLLHIKAENLLPAAIYPKTIHLPITTGAIFIFWTWLCLAFNDVFAYFVGKNMGRIKLGQISPAAGATSPNKTVEGVLGGCAVSAALGMLGAWVQKWPYWALTGMVHGTLLGLIGLIGDLTASMIKRDAGIKDFGDLIPEHGGILDRVDGFIWTAPYSWFVCHTVIPALKNAVR